MLQTVQAQHAALQTDHVSVQVALARSITETQEKVTILRQSSEALLLQTTSLEHDESVRKKKKQMQNVVCSDHLTGENST
jgi:hypothetical protein